MFGRRRGPLVDPTKQGAVLREMVREAERVIDHQVRVWERLDAKAEQLIRSALLTLAGAVALATFFLRQSEVLLDGLFLLLFLGAGLSIVLALLFFIASYAGFRSDRRLGIGPSPRWLADQAVRSEDSMADHLTAVLATYREDFRGNRAAMDLALRSRQRGLAALLVGILGYASAFAYVVGGSIL